MATLIELKNYQADLKVEMENEKVAHPGIVNLSTLFNYRAAMQRVKDAESKLLVQK